MNALLQQLFMQPKFRGELLDCPEPEKEDVDSTKDGAKLASFLRELKL